jgi:hypothetical protein
MAWIEGFTSSNEILKTIARNACTVFKDAAGELIPGKNWELIYPSPQKYRSIRRVLQEVLESKNYLLYNTSRKPIVPNRVVRVFRNGSLVSSTEYTVDYQNGTILFKEPQRMRAAVENVSLQTTDYRTYDLGNTEIIASTLKVFRNGAEVDPAEYMLDAKNGKVTFRLYQDESASITASYEYLSEPYMITADYTCYSNAVAVTGEVLKSTDGVNFSTQNGSLVSADLLKVYRNGAYVSPSEYAVDLANGTITFNAVQSNVSFVLGEALSSTDYKVYTVSNKPMTFEDEVVVYRDGNVVSPSEYTVDRINGKITFNNIQRRIVSVTQEVASTQDNKIYTVAGSPIVPGTVIVYRDSQPVDTSEYTVDASNSRIVFNTAQDPSAVITVDYSYYGTPYAITADYYYYEAVVSLQDVVLTTTNYITYSTGVKNVLPQNLVVKRNGQEVPQDEYTLDIQNGNIVFNTIQDTSAVITASFVFCPRMDYITADYTYYASVEDVLNEELVPVNNQLFKTANKPISAEHTLTVYLNGQAVDAGEYKVIYEDGTVVFNQSVDILDQATIDYSYYTNGIEEAIAAIKDRLVLKTTTTPVELTDEQKLQNLYSDERLNMTSLTMYVEFYKPERLINPETSTEYYKDVTGLYLRTGGNNHYVNVRMFDQWDAVTEQPVPSLYNSSGKLISAEAAVSPWSKLAWFRDWEEVPLAYGTKDTTDDNQLAKGSLFRPVELPSGLGEIPIRYWMSITNDRIIGVFMGEPSVSYNNYIMGFAYIGRIKPYEGGINDTFGNFALTTTSSTVPCKIAKPPAGKPRITSLTLNSTGGQLWKAAYYYVVTYITPNGESAPSDYKYVLYSGNSNTAAVTIEVELPDEATGWKIYRYQGGTSTQYNYPNDLSRYKLLAVISDAETTTYVDDGSVTPVNESPAPQGRSVAGIVRDSKTGMVIKVNYPDDYGSGTATGVTDISMYRTRGGAYYQQHRAAFHTPEEFMTKVGFNPSSFTGKVYVSYISVVHPFDGYRGTLDGVVAVDGTSLAPIDELVVNKGQPDEEVYKFFAINAPYSFISSSANSFYGIAIKKQ